MALEAGALWCYNAREVSHRAEQPWENCHNLALISVRFSYLTYQHLGNFSFAI